MTIPAPQPSQATAAAGQPRPEVAAAQRVVIKLGTRVLTHDDGRLALSRLLGVAEVAGELRRRGRDVLLVSSGAVGLGREALGLERIPTERRERQACAAVGQSRLMGLYQDGFARLGVVCAQVLLTQDDFSDRVRYLNLRSTLESLLEHGAVPVINENDAVATEELALSRHTPEPVFGDNDRLSALVATKLGAELLVLLTDVPGLFDRDPRRHPDAALVDRVDDPSQLAPPGAQPGSEAGRGGMRSKLEAASMAARGGCHAVIASGRDLGVLPRVLAGEAVGTWFPARDSLDARRRWIAFAGAARGTLHLDDGAVEAVRRRGASLLAAGVQRVDGEFGRGDVVELRGPAGERVGRGLIFWEARTARRWCAGTPPDGVRNHDALVHRRHLVLDGG
jgi:glutamate 5-kinase